MYTISPISLSAKNIKTLALKPPFISVNSPPEFPVRQVPVTAIYQAYSEIVDKRHDFLYVCLMIFTEKLLLAGLFSNCRVRT